MQTNNRNKTTFCGTLLECLIVVSLYTLCCCKINRKVLSRKRGICSRRHNAVKKSLSKPQFEQKHVFSFHGILYLGRLIRILQQNCLQNLFVSPHAVPKAKGRDDRLKNDPLVIKKQVIAVQKDLYLKKILCEPM